MEFLGCGAHIYFHIYAPDYVSITTLSPIVYNESILHTIVNAKSQLSTILLPDPCRYPQLIVPMS